VAVENDIELKKPAMKNGKTTKNKAQKCKTSKSGM